MKRHKQDKQRNHFRTCIVSRSKHEPKELLRFNLNRDTGVVSFDCNLTLKGRGAYVLRENLELLFKRRYLNRSFKMELSSEDYDRLYKEVAICQGEVEVIT